MSGLSTVLRVMGWSLIVMAAALLPSLFLDGFKHQAEWHVFGLIFLVEAFVGLALLLGVSGYRSVIDVRPILAAVLASSFTMMSVSGLPFLFGQTHCAIPDAIFEGVARITTSGGTIFSPLSELPPGLSLWRGMLQWLGGAWALSLGIAILPYLRVGGMSFFRVDAFAAMEPTTRARRLALALVGLYAGISFLLALLLWMAGMSALDAVIHAMGLISSGGASTWDTSLGHYNKVSITLIAAFGMILGGLPFPALLAAFRGNVRVLLADTQVHWYLSIIVIAAILLGWWGIWQHGWSWQYAVLDNSFSIISALTGSGYVTQPVVIGLGVPSVVFLFLATWGGCAGSSSGGLKIFRVRAMLYEIWIQMGALLRPHTIRAAKVDNRVLDAVTRRQIMGFVFVYTSSFAALSWGLGAMGLDAVTALSAAVTAIANASLNLGGVLSHSGGYAAMPDAAKVLLSVGMALGRLEILPVLAVFTPSFWRR